MLVLIHDTLRDYKDAQFILSTHSPILLGYPGAQIVSFDDGTLHTIAYEDTAAMQITRRFTHDRASFLAHLFEELPQTASLFEDGASPTPPAGKKSARPRRNPIA